MQIQKEILHSLCFGSAGELAQLRIAVVVAHPDDEIIGAGAQLQRWKKAEIIYVTDGSPRDGRDASQAGFKNRQDYADARIRESFAALSLAGIHWRQTRELGFGDQEASLNLLRVADALAIELADLQTDVVITQPYEGGHPDHDATAFAVHAACEILRHDYARAPEIIEMTSYHNAGGNIITGEFFPRAGCEPIQIELSAADSALKQRMFDCFKTQRRVLSQFSTRAESFRAAPVYDFTLPPHDGRLFYEMFDWGMDGRTWRTLAADALQFFKSGQRLIDSPREPLLI